MSNSSLYATLKKIFTNIEGRLPELTTTGKIPVSIDSLNISMEGGSGFEVINTTANPVPITDGGSSITVDGVITANLGFINGIATDVSIISILNKIPNNLSVVDGKLQVETGITQPLTNTQLRASAINISGTVTANAGTNLNTSALALESGGNLASINTKLPSGLVVSPTGLIVNTNLNQPLTESQLRASPIAVSTGLVQALTNTELRASPVPVTGTVTVNAGTNLNTSLLARETGGNLANINTKLPSGLTVTTNRLQVETGLEQGLTDIQLRATPLTITGTVTANTGLAQPLTDTQLRATPLPVLINNSSLEISNDAGNPIPINGTVTANAGTNLNTSLLALESGGNLASVNTKLPSGLTVTTNRLQVVTELLQPLTDIQLRATPLTITSSTPINFSSIGTNVTANIKASAGVLYSFNCTNLNDELRYLLIFNSTGSTAGTPLLSRPVYGNKGLLEIGMNVLGFSGLPLSTGITFAFSTAPLIYVAGSAIDCIFDCRYL